MLVILPYMEQQGLYDRWDFRTSVIGNADVADDDVPGFYCPTRRNKIRPEDLTTPNPRMIAAWNGGGTDYGGCLGSTNGWDNTAAQSGKHHKFTKTTATGHFWNFQGDATTPSLIGIFRPNVAASFADIKDGSSNTIMTGELQRLDGTTDDTDQPRRLGAGGGGHAVQCRQRRRWRLPPAD